jgi:hypothetical protein
MNPPAVMLPVMLTIVPVWLATLTMLVNMPLLAVTFPLTDENLLLAITVTVLLEFL